MLLRAVKICQGGGASSIFTQHFLLGMMLQDNNLMYFALTIFRFIAANKCLIFSYVVH